MPSEPTKARTIFYQFGQISHQIYCTVNPNLLEIALYTEMSNYAESLKLGSTSFV